MRSVQIYVENQRLDLFNDENISISSSTQDINDISKVFTDFSQTFTIPCTAKNNLIFEHYYNNDLENEIDHQSRRQARIEIDYVPFRYGTIQIEKATIKNGVADNYAVTFYGSVVTLKDLIGDDKLSQLDYSSLNHGYDGGQVKDRITTNPATTDYNVKYPLISSKRVWQYGTGGNNDITVNARAIRWTELFPAVRVASIFDLIEAQYGITFNGTWLGTERFRKLFLWYKNREVFTFTSEEARLTFAVGGNPADAIYESEVRIRYVDPSTLIVAPYDTCSAFRHKITCSIVTLSTDDYFIDVYKNGSYLFTIPGNGNDTFQVADVLNWYSMATDVYHFTFRASASILYGFTVDYNYTYYLTDTGVGSDQFIYSESQPATNFATSATLNLADLAPDMKITDFISGLFKVFNLTCYGNTNTDFQIEPLNSYYSKGNTYDITPYMVTDEIGVDRVKLYNKIAFKWQQSQNFLSREFFDLFDREYGDLSADFGFDGGDYTIELPFETILHQRFSSTGLHVGYCLGTLPEYKTYVPKPVLLYENDYQTGQSFKFNNGSTVSTITTYVPFGQDLPEGATDYTLNFGSEYSSFTWDIEVNSLYKTYYEDYLVNMFNQKTRQINIKTILPTSILTDLKLNDTLIVRDKKYIINNMNTNLTTGEVDFTLLSSWRDDALFGVTFNIDNTAQSVYYEFNIPTDTTITIGGSIEASFTTISDSTPTNDQIVTFTCTANGTAAVRTNTFPLTMVRNGVTLPTQYIIIIQEA